MFETNFVNMEKQPLLSMKNASVSRSLLASFLASLMSFAAGTVVAGWTPSQLPTTPMTIGEKLFAIKTMNEMSWIVSIYVFGALVGAIPAGQISQTIGRKKTLLLLAVPMTVGWIIIMFFVDNIYLVYIGRILCGLSLGAVTVAVPLYNNDVASDVCRGRGGVFLDFMLCAGILYSYIASSFMGLRMFSLTCSLIPVVFCILFSFMPESPQYLYSKRRYVESKEILLWLRGQDFDVNDEFDKYARLQNEEGESPATLIKNKSFEKSPTFMKALILSTALATIQRMSGAGAIIQYTTKLFEISGSSVQPITASIITGVFQLIGSGVTIALIDKVGRRKLLLVSSVVVVACLSMLTLYFYYLNKGLLENSFRILPIFIVCMFIAFFRLGLGPIPWFMFNELLGSDHNNRAESYVASYSWMLSFFVMKTFIPLVNDWPVALWLGYSVISFIGLIFILFFIPETNNKNNDEVRSLLMKTCQITCQNDEVKD